MGKLTSVPLYKESSSAVNNLQPMEAQTQKTGRVIQPKEKERERERDLLSKRNEVGFERKSESDEESNQGDKNW